MSARLGTSLRRLLENVGLLPTPEERLLDELERDLATTWRAQWLEPVGQLAGPRDPLRAEILALIAGRRFEMLKDADAAADGIVAIVQREMFALLAEAGQDIDPEGPAADLVGWLADAVKAMDGGR